MNIFDLDNLNGEKDMVQNGSFVRKDFYIDPPSADATPEEWAEWLKADRAACIAAKREFTRQYNKTIGVKEESPEIATVKRGGKWVQGSPSLAYSGDDEAGTLTQEVAVQATQERELVSARIEADKTNRGTVSKGRHARRRAAKKAARNGGIKTTKEE